MKATFNVDYIKLIKTDNNKLVNKTEVLTWLVTLGFDWIRYEAPRINEDENFRDYIVMRKGTQSEKTANIQKDYIVYNNYFDQILELTEDEFKDLTNQYQKELTNSEPKN